MRVQILRSADTVRMAGISIHRWLIRDQRLVAEHSFIDWFLRVLRFAPWRVRAELGERQGKLEPGHQPFGPVAVAAAQQQEQPQGQPRSRFAVAAIGMQPLGRSQLQHGLFVLAQR